MKIDELLEKYFAGETSMEEEKELRQFFSSETVSPHLSAYKPLFAYFDEEIARRVKPVVPVRNNKRIARYFLYGVAAASLVVLGVRGIYTSFETYYCSGNYVVINGRCYTDDHKIRSMALNALREVATPVEAYFPGDACALDDQEIMKTQLKELGNLFNEE
ncbi:MAG: hypothetical protein PHG27_01460 [Massilibacteroides sp.]|nr:hypothetical protein [Massilibacteroides sp.]MDD3063581.1 hypothetical protein [Massilibacteroides sp.]MDD4114254.1 hypothetical protein [Massilibacteroides sp.]MDD4661006.1 hypothetical protein [Massilibacteroides sp.]